VWECLQRPNAPRHSQNAHEEGQSGSLVLFKQEDGQNLTEQQQDMLNSLGDARLEIARIIHRLRVFPMRNTVDSCHIQVYKSYFSMFPSLLRHTAYRLSVPLIMCYLLYQIYKFRNVTDVYLWMDVTFGELRRMTFECLHQLGMM
jgi:hypothetical protein